MILYNVTVKVIAEIQQDWLDWMRTVHIPDVMNTGLFSSYKICKILHDEPDGGVTYAIQYFCKDRKDFEHYQKEHAKALQADHTKRYDGKYVAFRTLMEVVEG